MPQIQTYEGKTTVAQGGSLNARANPDEFGAQIGQATQRLGGSIQDVGEAVQQYNTTQDVTNVYVNMQKARSEWTKNLQDRQNSAQPGDETFAPTVMKDMTTYFQKFNESVQTPEGKRVAAREAAAMTGEFTRQAIGIQGELAAKDAVNKYDVLAKSTGSTVFQDHTQLAATIEAGKRAIDDPNGMFSKIPQTARDEMKLKLENDANYAAARGFVRAHPDAVLQSIAPDMLQQFDPAGKVIQANTVKGGSASISPKAKAWAQPVTKAAALKGLNPNILLAQIDQESGGNPNAVGPMTKSGTAKGLTQFVDATAKQYGVNVNDPQSAISGQANYMSDLLKKYGGDYTKALAAYNWGPGNLDGAMSRWGNQWANHLPTETSNYVSNIMRKAGAVVTDPNLQPQEDVGSSVTAAPVRAPVSSQLPFVSGLTWQQQEQVVSEAIQLQNMKMSMAERARVESERALQQQRENTYGAFIERMLDPKTNGGMFNAQEVANDPVLTGQQKQALMFTSMSYASQVAAGAESKSNPEEVRRLMLLVHAADDDPTKAYSMDPVNESFRNGKISPSEYRTMRTEVEQMRDGNGNNLAKQAQQAREVVFQSFTGSIEGRINPAKAASAAYTFNRELDRKILEYRKEGKDPSVLLDPTSREYMLNPEKLNGYGMTVNYSAATQTNIQTSQELANQAAKAVQAEVPVGTVKDGYRFKGGNPGDKANWERI